jgi:ABC-type uncharacterized transport system ATPase subunit
MRELTPVERKHAQSIAELFAYPGIKLTKNQIIEALKLGSGHQARMDILPLLDILVEKCILIELNEPTGRIYAKPSYTPEP